MVVVLVKTGKAGPLPSLMALLAEFSPAFPVL